MTVSRTNSRFEARNFPCRETFHVEDGSGELYVSTKTYYMTVLSYERGVYSPKTVVSISYRFSQQECMRER